MKPIQITSGLRIELTDLCRTVDISKKFTLRDIITTAFHNIFLQDILVCPYIHDFFQEMNSKPFKNDGDIDYLEVYWNGSKLEDECYSSWDFHGIGKEGVIGDDVKQYVSKDKHSKYRENYAIELSPLYTLADYEIRIRPEMILCIDSKLQNIKFTPSITLIELLYTIFHELSFYGGVKERNKMIKNLKSKIKNIKKSKPIKVPKT